MRSSSGRRQDKGRTKAERLNPAPVVRKSCAAVTSVRENGRGIEREGSKQVEGVGRVVIRRLTMGAMGLMTVVWDNAVAPSRERD